MDDKSFLDFELSNKLMNLYFSNSNNIDLITKDELKKLQKSEDSMKCSSVKILDQQKFFVGDNSEKIANYNVNNFYLLNDKQKNIKDFKEFSYYLAKLNFFENKIDFSNTSIEREKNILIQNLNNYINNVSFNSDFFKNEENCGLENINMINFFDIITQNKNTNINNIILNLAEKYKEKTGISLSSNGIIKTGMSISLVLRSASFGNYELAEKLIKQDNNPFAILEVNNNDSKSLQVLANENGIQYRNNSIFNILSSTKKDSGELIFNSDDLERTNFNLLNQAFADYYNNKNQNSEKFLFNLLNKFNNYIITNIYDKSPVINEIKNLISAPITQLNINGNIKSLFLIDAINDLRNNIKNKTIIIDDEVLNSSKILDQSKILAENYLDCKGIYDFPAYKNKDNRSNEFLKYVFSDEGIKYIENCRKNSISSDLSINFKKSYNDISIKNKIKNKIYEAEKELKKTAKINIIKRSKLNKKLNEYKDELKLFNIKEGNNLKNVNNSFTLIEKNNLLMENIFNGIKDKRVNEKDFGNIKYNLLSVSNNDRFTNIVKFSINNGEESLISFDSNKKLKNYKDFKSVITNNFVIPKDKLDSIKGKIKINSQEKLKTKDVEIDNTINKKNINCINR